MKEVLLTLIAYFLVVFFVVFLSVLGFKLALLCANTVLGVFI